jgi:hypothetical protein
MGEAKPRSSLHELGLGHLGFVEDFIMRRLAIGGESTNPSWTCRLAAAFWLALATSAIGQGAPGRDGDRPDSAGPYPRLPGAITKAPNWIGADPPFDVARYFAPVPRERNAAPLYLDAFFEFGTEMASCFREGPERDRRHQAADDRMKRYIELEKALSDAPDTVPTGAIDAVIASYASGFEKLVEAQRRDRCVFETGIGVEAPLSQAQVCRQVARIAALRTRRAVERGDYDAAIREVDIALRMVRDLRPRGFMITQLVAAAITQVTCADMINRILAGPGLRVEHCDRLLKRLLDHEAKSEDGYAEGLKAEYLLGRTELRKSLLNLTPEAQRAASDDLAGAVRSLNDYYRTLLSLDGVPFARRLEKVDTLTIAKGNDQFSRLLATIEPSIEPVTRAIGRMDATIRASECMIVMRRWQLTHRGLPRALTLAVKEAGLKAIPVDPYDGKPMRVAVLGSPRVIYSVGKDGRDDGGQKDSKYDTLLGDLIYHMPEIEDRR